MKMRHSSDVWLSKKSIWKDSPPFICILILFPFHFIRVLQGQSKKLWPPLKKQRQGLLLRNLSYYAGFFWRKRKGNRGVKIGWHITFMCQARSTLETFSVISPQGQFLLWWSLFILYTVGFFKKKFSKKEVILKPKLRERLQIAKEIEVDTHKNGFKLKKD